MNLSPKGDFLKSQDAKTIQNLVVMPEFRRAISAALLQYQVDQHSPLRADNDQSNAAAVSWRISGAVAFATMLLNISEVPQPKSVRIAQNLSS